MQIYLKYKTKIQHIHEHSQPLPHKTVRSNNPGTYTHPQICTHKDTIIASPHTQSTYPHINSPLFSSVRSLSYMLSPRPYKADPLCSDILFFVLEKNLGTGSQPCVCCLFIPQGSVCYSKPKRSAICKKSAFQELEGKWSFFLPNN